MSSDEPTQATSPNMLKDTMLGAGLRDDQLQVLSTLAQLKRFEPKQSIVTPEDSSFPVMVLISGRADVFGLFEDVVNVIEPGGLIGEVSFMDRKPRSAAVIAHSACEVAVLSEDVIAWLNMERPDIVAHLLYNIGRELCGKLRSAQRLINATDALTGGAGNTPPGTQPRIIMLE